MSACILVGAAMPVGATTPKSLVATDKMYNNNVSPHALPRQKNLLKLDCESKKTTGEKNDELNVLRITFV